MIIPGLMNKIVKPLMWATPNWLLAKILAIVDKPRVR
jgi:hypothetical protein